MYKIVRFYSKPDPRDPYGHLLTKRRTITAGLTLEEAQRHCSDPQTSSRTATGAARRPGRGGWNWFDGYDET